MTLQLAGSKSVFKGRCVGGVPRAIRGPPTSRFAVHPPSAKPRGLEAAEQLAKAAIGHTQAGSLGSSKEAVAELKRMADFTEKTADKLEALEGQVASLATHVTEVKKQAVTQTLQWAISNAEVAKFDYYLEDGCKAPGSSGLVKRTLVVFMRGQGMWIDNSYSKGSGTADDQTRQAFRDALSQQIHGLTGVKPRFQLEKNEEGVDQYAIYRV